ncbi:MAG TPA: hypothetical protein PLL75_03085 [Candidatus Omnitrophota bacterium]|nr:hypothetical protein [Candidatus Omnitrophota bacterium]HPS36696.1 hypothetical protein [Candidatus Omnitrophota bacterium]
MFQSKKIVSVLALIIVVGTAFVLSGCATCCSGESKTKAPSTGGMLRGTMGCDDCEKSSSPLLVEKEMPKQIVVGKPYTYTILVSNKSECGLDDVVVTERIPDQYEMNTAAPEPTKTSGRVAEWALGYLKPKETKTITITGVAKAAGNTVSCTKATYSPTLCLGPEAISPSLKVALEAANQALLCDVIPAKLTITNSGTGYAQDAAIQMSLPAGLTTTDGKSSIQIDAGDLQGGASKSYSLNLKASKPGNYGYKASAAAANGLSAASGSVSTSVKQPQLKVGVAGPDKVFVTKDATYQVTVQNVGDAASANTMVSATIPAGMKFVGASNGGTADDGRVKWNIGTLDAGKAVKLDATYKSVTGGTGESVANATGSCCQEASAAVKSDVQGIPAILLEVIDTEDPVQVGGTEKFYVTVTNQGSAADKNIVIKMSFEENFDYVSSSGPTQGKAEGTKSVEFAPLGSLAAGQKATWEVTAKAVSEGDHRTTLVMTSDAITRPVQETEATRVY